MEECYYLGVMVECKVKKGVSEALLESERRLDEEECSRWKKVYKK